MKLSIVSLYTDMPTSKSKGQDLLQMKKFNNVLLVIPEMK